MLACSQMSGDSLPRLADVEARLWTALLALALAVMALFLARCADRPRPATYGHNGQRFASDASSRRSTEIGARFGKLPFCRPVGLPLGGASRAPFLEQDPAPVEDGQWEAFTRFIAARSVGLAAQPTPTRTHDAKPQQFAQAA